MKAIEVKHRGVKCDLKGCDYVDELCPMETKKQRKRMVGVPCPKCGSSLLTKQDYYLCNVLDWLVKLVNSLFGEISQKDVDKSGGRVHISVEMDGSGVPMFKVDDNEKEGSK